MSESVEQKVRQIAADVFNLHPSKVTADTSPQTVENWDSVQHLNFVLALEEELGIQLEPEEVEQIRTVGNAIELVARKR